MNVQPSITQQRFSVERRQSIGDSCPCIAPILATRSWECQAYVSMSETARIYIDMLLKIDQFFDGGKMTHRKALHNGLRHIIQTAPPSEPDAGFLQLESLRALIQLSERESVLKEVAPLNQADLLSILFKAFGAADQFLGSTPSGQQMTYGDRLIQAVNSYLDIFPAQYFLYLPMQCFSPLGEIEYELTSQISIVSVPHHVVRNGTIPFDAGSAPFPALRVKCEGYLDGENKSSAAIAGLSKVREFLYLSDLFGHLRQQHFGILSGGAVKLNTADVVWNSIDLANEESGNFSNSSLMEYVKTRQPDSTPSGLLEFTALEPVQAYRRLVERTTRLRPFFDAPDNDSDLAGLRTAIEWAFASETAEETSMAFIQAFFSLEALLGAHPVDRDGKQKNQSPGSMTDRLADRYAYLVGKTRKDREEHEKTFRELYWKRGAIVHGKAPRSSLEHINTYSSKTQAMCRKAILAELDRYL